VVRFNLQEPVVCGLVAGLHVSVLCHCDSGLRARLYKAVRFRINQEIKFLYCKKLNFNNQLLHLHLEAAKLFNKKCDKYQAIPHHTMYM
jgi:hypothetical protein